MKDNITDWALNRYKTIYKDDSITKEDIFYYVYGILHHNGYRQRYRKSLVRGLPHIPMAPDFRAFSEAGRNLAALHLNYSMGPRYDLGKPLKPIPNQPRQIKFSRKPNLGPGGKTIDDLSTLIIDDVKVYDNLPESNYKVNGRTPIQWFSVVYSFKRNKDSDIANWPLEGASGEIVREIVERLAYVGVESDRIIASLPAEFQMNDIEEASEGLDKYAEVV